MVRNILLIVFLMCTFQVSFAQEYKGSATKAANHLANNDLVKAKGEIDAAIKIEKAASKAKTWSTRGMIYKAIGLSEEAPGSLENAQVVGESFKKVFDMEKPGSFFYEESNNALTSYYAKLINTGVDDYYNKGDFKTAIGFFENANAVKIVDSLALYLTATAALQIEDYDKSEKAYNALVENGYATKEIFQNLIFIARIKKEDNETAMEVIQKAKELYPDETIFVREEISILVTEDRLEEARAGMEKQLEQDPQNISYLVSLGIIYDNLATDAEDAGNLEEAKKLEMMAVEKYKESVSVDPENYAANKNLASYYVSKANNDYKAATDDMDYRTYLKQGKKYEDQRSETYRNGLPYMEKAASIRENDVLVLEELKQLYVTLKMNDKALEVQERIEALQ